MKPRYNRPAQPTTRLRATARQAYMAQVARISVQYWAPIQLELSSTYWSTSGTARAARKNGTSTRARVNARFQPAGPERQSCPREAVDSATSAFAGSALMPDP